MYLAMFVSVVLSMVLGWLWYSEMLFGKLWMKEMGIVGVDKAKMKKEMPKAIVMQLIATIVMAAVLSWISMSAEDWMDWMEGAKVGFILWFGFMATTAISQVAFERKSGRWFCIHAGYSLVQMVVMGAILAY